MENRSKAILTKMAYSTSALSSSWSVEVQLMLLLIRFMDLPKPRKNENLIHLMHDQIIGVMQHRGMHNMSVASTLNVLAGCRRSCVAFVQTQMC